jgi:hypothetical protein
MTLSSRTQRRVSRFRRRYNGRPQPNFQVGDTAGEFNVINYLGHTNVAPEGKPRVLSQDHHWYKVRCSCGNEEIHTQQQLIDIRRSRKCASCIKETNVENQSE